MATVKELEAQVLALTNKVNELVATVQPMADEIVHLRGRIDDAARVFGELRKAVTPKPHDAPAAPTTRRIPRREFDRALEDLRAEASEQGSDRTFFPAADILRRAETLAAMERNKAAA